MSETASLFVLGSFVVACSAKVARLPCAGESLQAEAFTVEAGGKGFNLALGAHRLGAGVTGLLAIGDDLFSQLAELALARTGLPPDMLRRYPTTTGSGIGFTDASGENCLAVHPGANRYLSAKDVRSADGALRSARLVLAQFEIGDEPIVEAFTLAREAGIPTLLNPSPFRPLTPGILARTSILVVNRVEAAILAGREGAASLQSTGSDPLRAFAPLADALLAQGPEIVVVTLGADGAVAFRRDAEPVRQTAFPIEAIDTLGAGDGFTAGLATGLAEGLALPEALRRAAACGAMVASRLGVFEALPSRLALMSFLADAAERLEVA